MFEGGGVNERRILELVREEILFDDATHSSILRYRIEVVVRIVLVHEASHGTGIPAVLDGVFRAARQQFGDFAPAVPKVPLRVDQDAVFFVGPLTFDYRRIEMIEPALAALLPEAAR